MAKPDFSKIKENIKKAQEKHGIPELNNPPPLYGVQEWTPPAVAMKAYPSGSFFLPSNGGSAKFDYATFSYATAQYYGTVASKHWMRIILEELVGSISDEELEALSETKKEQVAINYHYNGKRIRIIVETEDDLF